ncbi:MAG: SulP family sulfate permease [Cocleimonas sp.]|jgi:SulP family sulfate permease
MNIYSLFPFLKWFKLVTSETIKADILAGLTGAVIVLPQGVAFATIAGLPPEYGLYTAMVTPIIAALFGSSHHLVSGPTTAISIVMFLAISNHAESGTPEFLSLAITLTFLTGLYQLAFGLAKLGSLINFVSHTVVTAFTAGAAILIATSQMKHITGIFVPKGESFIHTWAELVSGIGQINIYLLIIAAATMLTAILVKRINKKLPYLLLGMVVGSLVALFLGKYNSDIKLVGEIPASLPPLSMPDLSFTTIKSLAPEAFAVALLGLIEAVSISRSISSKSDQRVNSSQEFIGQGMSNLVGSFFSCYAGSGSFTRSGVNYEAGAKTPLSAILAAVFLVLIVLLVAPLTAYLPIAAMGGVVLLVAYNLIDFTHIKETIAFGRSEAAILFITFFSTLFLELEIAIYLGVITSLVLFLAKTSTPNVPVLSIDEGPKNTHRKFIDIKDKSLPECPQLKIIRIDMSIYFGSVNHILKVFGRIELKENINHILIESSGINFIDLAGAEMLISENKRLMKQGGGLYFVGLKQSVYEAAVNSNFFKQIGEEHYFDSKSEAIRVIYRDLDKNKCSQCKVRIFDECNASD